MKIRLPTFTILALLASCGGGGSSADPYQQAIDQANAEQAQAESLGVAAPCAQTSQCGTLEFYVATATCDTPSYQAYSLVSSSAAAASSAAADQRALAITAMSLAPGSHVCPADLMAPPSAVCSAGSCSLSH